MTTAREIIERVEALEAGWDRLQEEREELAREVKEMDQGKTEWKCEVCGRKQKLGAVEEFGVFRQYRCRRHPGGKSIALVMADIRRRKTNDASFRRRGVSSATYRGMVQSLEADRAGGIRLGGDGRYHDREGNVVPPEKVLEAMGIEEEDPTPVKKRDTDT